MIKKELKAKLDFLEHRIAQQLDVLESSEDTRFEEAEDRLEALEERTEALDNVNLGGRGEARLDLLEHYLGVKYVEERGYRKVRKGK